MEHYDVIEMQKRFSISYEHVNEYFDAHFSGRFNGVTLSISNRGNNKWKLYMFVDVIKLLGKHDLSEADCSSLENEIKLVLYCLFQHFGYYQDHVLQRIDFRYDVVVPKNERELLLHIYQKLTKSYRYQVKYLGTIDDSGEFKKYETTVYHSSKSVQSVVYSKEDERMAKSQPLEEYEKDVLRFEVRIDKSHINYMSRQDKGNNRPKKLRDYMKDDVYKEYFSKYMSPIYHSGNFYKIDEARKVIRKSSLSQTNKAKLIEFLKQVSSHSLDTPLKHMSKSTYNNRLQMLKDLGINPILIPKNYSKAPNTLKNPLDDFPW